MSLPRISFPTWITSAACTDTYPETFFPHEGSNSAEAKAICAGCPVRPQCLDYAMAFEADHPGSRHGIYGATTPDERRLLAKAAS